MNSLALVTAEDPKRLDEALGYARNAATLAPERGEIADTYGWLLYQAGKTKEAATMLTRAAALLPQAAVVQFHTGMALSREGRTPEARQHLDRALRLDAKFDGADTARAELDRLR
jgi:Tfp pilus assembly protein PilF